MRTFFGSLQRVAAVHVLCLGVWAASVQELQGQGAAPQAVAALQELAAKPVPVLPPIPSSEGQAKLLDAVRGYALNYTGSLPDFICLEETRRYVDSEGQQAWRLMDVLTARLSYFDRKEDYKLVSQNGRAAKDASYESAGGALSMGDFGTIMRDIFDPASHTSFAWEKWTTLRGRPTQVFSYRVPLPLYTIAYQGERYDGVQKAKVAYRGSVFVDKEFHTIVRITHEALNIPPSFPVREATETLDYDFIRIGEGRFFLPLANDLQMHIRTYNGGLWTKNEKAFRLYRKFSAGATIKFDAQELPQ